MRQFSSIEPANALAFVLESERFTAKNRRRESWRNHVIVDAESGHRHWTSSTADGGEVLQLC
jgi:hypothetical protein